MICETCGKEHNGSYGSGRFCSKECASSFSGKHSGPGVIYDTCNCCGKKILVKKHSSKSTRLCDECKQNVNTTNYTTNTCKICGRRLIKRKKCENDFCKKHSLKQIRTLIKYFGFNELYVGTKDVEQEFNRVRQILYSLYWDDCLCGEEISQLYGYKNSHNLTQSIFKYLEIPTRNKVKDFLQNSIFNGRFRPTPIETCYKTTWHTTWENKEVFLRSSYELDYALELDKKQIKYDVESLRIKYFDSERKEYRCAIPDFYLIDENTIVEIKSSWTYNKQNMQDKFNAYKQLGYKTKLILDHVEYIEII